jgi:multidrug resistance efflux pump
MKITKVLSLILALSLIGVVAAGCSKKTVTTTTTTSEVTVGTGNITVSITSTGSMDYSDYENLSFAADGTIGTLNVKVGDLVTKGQVLAVIDSDFWSQNLDTLTQALQTANRNLTSAKSNITNLQNQVTAKELAVSQAELALQTAQNNLAVQVDQDQLNIANAQIALKTAQDNLDEAQANYDSNWTIPDYILAYAQTQAQLKVAQDNLAAAQTTLAADQANTGHLQIDQAQLQITQSQQALGDAKTAVTNAQTDEASAEQAVTDAQTALDIAKAISIQITAPFDGAVTTVNITQGGATTKGATAIVLADTSKFKASLMVNEADIPNISVGTMAAITATALPDVTLNARVTAISPVATIQSGVVNYAVTATILGIAPAARTSTSGSTSGQSGTTTTPSTGQSGATTTPATTGRQRIITTSGAPSQSGASGTPPTTLPFGNGQIGNLTPDQLAQLQQRIQQGGGAGFGQSNAASATVQLRQGLSLTVNLIEQQKLNVITVPNSAIKTISGKTYVQVKTSNGTPEQREVTIGLKDYQNTEIVSGLTAGEVILITKTSSTVTTTTPRSGGGFGIGGGIIR